MLKKFINVLDNETSKVYSYLPKTSTLFSKDNIEILGIVVGIVGVISSGIYFLYSQFRKKQLSLRKKLRGVWGNEGDMALSKYETHFIIMELGCNLCDGALSGTFQCRNITTGDEFEMDIGGNFSFTKVRLDVITFRQQSLKTCANFRIYFKQGGLVLKLTGGSNVLFPNVAYLFKR